MVKLGVPDRCSSDVWRQQRPRPTPRRQDFVADADHLLAFHKLRPRPINGVPSGSKSRTVLHCTPAIRASSPVDTAPPSAPSAGPGCEPALNYAPGHNRAAITTTTHGVIALASPTTTVDRAADQTAAERPSVERARASNPQP